jgi:hypothetical protein
MCSCKRPGRPAGSSEPRCAGNAQETTSLVFQRAAQAYQLASSICVSIMRMDNTSLSRSSIV